MPGPADLDGEHGAARTGDPRSRLGFPYRDEHEVAREAFACLDGKLRWDAVAARAADWIMRVRRDPGSAWALERLLAEFPMSGSEGRALMRLAEALPRVPDRATAIALTADQLGRAHFEAHQGHGLGALSAHALALSSTLLAGEDPAAAGLVRRLGAEVVVTLAARAVQLLAHQFVFGESIEDALERADTHRAAHPELRFSFDMLGEGARTDAAALRYLAHYGEALDALVARASHHASPQARDGLSIKLSALFPRYEELQRDRVLSELVPRLWMLCDRAAAAGINLTIDAEESERLELSLDVFEALLRRIARSRSSWSGFGLAIQAYQTRALPLSAHVIALARKHGLRLMVRLVKGAYWDAEIKRAQVLGVPGYPVFTHKSHADLSYLACARLLLDAGDVVYPQFASHNAATIAAILELARQTDAAFELQRLHGMGDTVYREVAADARVPCRVYAPVGNYRDLLAYLVRRLLENGANSSFVHQLADPSVPIETLVRSPLHVRAGPGLPPPLALYGPRRRNSAGVDLSVREARIDMRRAFEQIHIAPVQPLDGDQAGAVMSRLQHGFPAWSGRDVHERSDILRTAACALEARLPEFAARIVREAAKTWDDAIAEVREAVDFLRYYAVEAESVLAPVKLPGPTGESNELRLRARGVWVCISPWNFPLAIFTGQIAAALVTGNTVAAKPAEQTPAVAAAMVELLHVAGVADDALILAPGAGETVGAALVADARTAGVAFTGSTAVAASVARVLAERAERNGLVPLIAETAGINAMIVDSTALPEQVVDSVIASAFRSAGQRCSALRLLCLHTESADTVLEMLEGAMAELIIGDPADPASDIGPLIDAEAKLRIEAQCANIERRGRRRYRVPLPEGLTGAFLAPSLYEVQAVDAVDQEIFGPVLQVVRWSGAIDPLVDRINALGYGLTLGIHTRLEGRAERVAARARIGNVYVNRNIIGAVVGVQPFGGTARSGTGPKAGGPHYLARFCMEQTVTINTAAAGGDVGLLAGSGESG